MSPRRRLFGTCPQCDSVYRLDEARAGCGVCGTGLSGRDPATVEAVAAPLVARPSVEPRPRVAARLKIVRQEPPRAQRWAEELERSLELRRTADVSGTAARVLDATEALQPPASRVLAAVFAAALAIAGVAAIAW